MTRHGKGLLLLLFAMALVPCHAQKKLALAVGIAGYPNFPEGDKLKFAGRDAEQFAAFIKTPEGGSFAPGNVHVLTNKQAIREHIYDEFDWLYTEAGPSDTVYVFFAGHGMEYRGTGYFLPYDTVKEHPDGLGIPMAEFYKKVTKDLAAKQVVVFVDACHSALAEEGGRSVASAEVEKTWEQQSDKAGQVSMALFSSRGNERSWEDPDLGGGHGLFTWFLLQGLQGAAPRTQQGFITADNLWDYVRSAVETRSRERFPEVQSPIASVRFRADLPLAYVGPEKKAPTEREVSTEELIREIRTANYARGRELAAQLIARGPKIAPQILSDGTGGVELQMLLGEVLGGLGKGALPAIIAGLRDPNQTVRELAAEALIKVPSKEAVPALLHAFLEATTASEINQTATALTWAPDPSVVKPMIQCLSYPDPYHYWNAARVLGAIGRPAVAAVPDLIAVLDRKGGVEWPVTDALASIGDVRAIPALAKLLEPANLGNGDPQSTFRALAKFGPAAAPAVPQILHVSPGSRFALETLEAIGDAGVPALVAGLSDRNSRVRELAARALGNIGLTEDAAAALKRLAADSNQPPNVIRAATDALNGVRYGG